MRLTLLLAVLLATTACERYEPTDVGVDGAAVMEYEAISLLGDTLRALPLDADTEARLQANLDSARTVLAANPDDVDAHIWVGRRLAYLGRYRDAIDVFSQALERWPDEPKLLRHRGHRYISVREFENAEADLARAAALIEGTEDEIEPDGAPNAYNIPRTTLHDNIYYHLGLAHYLQGEYEEAAAAYRNGLGTSTNDDMLVATLDWYYMALRRLGRDEEAEVLLDRVQQDMDILENDAYHQRLLMYKGEVAPESLLDPEGADELQLATQGYGVANWHLAEGRADEAEAIFSQILDNGYWPAFGYIAAEADVERGIE